MQNVVCNDLGLVVKGIFRIYYNDPVTDEEKEYFLLFFGKTSLLYPSGVSSPVIPVHIS